MKNKNILKILFVEDLPSDAELAILELQKNGLKFEHLRVDTRVGFIKAFNDFKPDMIISDYMMPLYDGMQALSDSKEIDPQIPFILFTGSINEETAVKCIQAGADDYIIKEHLTRLPYAVKEVLEKCLKEKEKRAAELLLKENEEKLQSIFRAAPVGIGLVVDRVFIEVNDTFCTMTGYTRKELIGKSAEMIYATKEEFESVGIDKYGQIAEKGIGSVETRFKCKDGRIINVLMSSTPLDKSDLPKGVTFTVMDITERVQAEEALANEKYLIYSLMSTLPDHIYFKDLNSRFIRINKAHARFFGLSDPDQAVGKTDSDYFSEEHAMQAYEDEQTIIRTGQPLIKEEKETQHNSPDTWVSTVKMPLKDKVGVIFGTFGISRDITERKHAEEALQKSQHLFQTLAQVSPVGIFRTDPFGKTTYVNPKWIELSGLSFEEAIGIGWLNAVHPEDREKLKEEWLINFQYKNESGAEYRFLRPDGSTVWVMGKAVPELIDNEVAGYIGTITDITELKQSEEVLRKSKQIIEGIINAIPVRVFWKDENLVYLGCNTIFAHDSGFDDPADLIGKSDYQMGWHDQAEMYRADDKQVIESGLPKLFIEESQMTPKGNLITLLTSKIPLVGTKGEIYGVLGTYIDITERKQVEEALRESEEKYRLLINTANESIIVAQDGLLKFVNNITIELLEASSEQEVIGRPFPEFIHPDDQSMVIENYRRRMTNEGTPQRYSFRVVTSKGIVKWVELNATLIEWQGRPATLNFLYDITERKKVENDLQESEAKFRLIMENSADAIFITDQQGNYIYSNKEVTALLGYTSEEMKKKTIIDLSPQDKMDEYSEIFKKTLIEGKVYAEIELLKKDGNFISTDLNAVLLPGGLVYGSCRDITERKHAKEELIKAKDKAEEGDRLKTAFLQNISHEIRTPMNAIVGFTALLGDPEVDKKSREEYIEIIMQSSNHLLTIVSDIMDISNIEANIAKIVKSNTNVNSILQSLCEQYITIANEKKIKLVCETSLSDSEALVLADSTKLKQILINMINNAIKFTEKGYVKVGCVLTDKFLEFNVTDSGIGISEQYHQKIFDRFYQVQHSVSKIYEGTGLGLAISKAHVDLMGGKLWLTSEPGKGSSFYFTIPYEQQVEETLAFNERRVPEDFVFPENRTILVAEDSDSNFKLIEHFLSDTNTKLLRAKNGKEAVEISLKDRSIDLILMDIKMPVMDGYTAVELIRTANTKIPIIAQTAYTDDREKAIEAGCNEFILKPLDRMHLIKTMCKFISC